MTVPRRQGGVRVSEVNKSCARPIRGPRSATATGVRRATRIFRWPRDATDTCTEQMRRRVWVATTRSGHPRATIVKAPRDARYKPSGETRGRPCPGHRSSARTRHASGSVAGAPRRGRPVVAASNAGDEGRRVRPRQPLDRLAAPVPPPRVHRHRRAGARAPPASRGHRAGPGRRAGTAGTDPTSATRHRTGTAARRALRPIAAVGSRLRSVPADTPHSWRMDAHRRLVHRSRGRARDPCPSR
ncbi:hypothetical protein BURK1_03759 [Burkholderiales bacterium]|nr:hypothetical protein BURK1_03759 [Burkholderiales bacterium]